VKAVRELVEQEWEDTEELTQAILDTLVEVKWARGGWVVIFHDPDTLPKPVLYGPYQTSNQATKDVNRRIIGSSGAGRAGVFHVKNLDAIEQASDMVLFG